MSRGTRHVAVVGAGLAGLLAARELRRRGISVTVYEAGRQVAGLARSFTDRDGFTYDFGAHFITNRLAAALGIGAQCRDVHYYGESVVLDGRVLPIRAAKLASVLDAAEVPTPLDHQAPLDHQGAPAARPRSSRR